MGSGLGGGEGLPTPSSGEGGRKGELGRAVRKEGAQPRTPRTTPKHTHAHTHTHTHTHTHYSPSPARQPVKNRKALGWSQALSYFIGRKGSRDGTGHGENKDTGNVCGPHAQYY